jgi:hypothetical protein
MADRATGIKQSAVNRLAAISLLLSLTALTTGRAVASSGTFLCALTITLNSPVNRMTASSSKF